MLKNRTVEYLRQHRIILRADAASEVHQLLSKKRREYFAYYRVFLQRRWCAAAAGAVRKASAVNDAVLPYDSVTKFSAVRLKSLPECAIMQTVDCNRGLSEKPRQKNERRGVFHV